MNATWLLAMFLTLGQAQPNIDPTIEQLRQAQALMKNGDYQQAVLKLREAQKLGAYLSVVSLHLAKAYAALGDRDAAFRELTKVTELGLASLIPPFDTDPDIQGLRVDPRFDQFEKALSRNARPCEHDSNYRQLDYWLGTWDVRPNGAPNNPPSTNVITRVLGDCVILESWTAPGQAGQSFNIYDRAQTKWRQTWVDSTGSLHEYWGTLIDGNMVYEGDLPGTSPTAPRVHTRLTFFRQPDGSVRQYSERTEDGGKSWKLNYDLIYTRRRE